jgi:hypothetical protein
MRFVGLALEVTLTVFVTLKLTGYVSWSWAWVLAPMWVPILIVATAVFIAGRRSDRPEEQLVRLCKFE